MNTSELIQRLLGDSITIEFSCTLTIRSNAPAQIRQDAHTVTCPDCGWTATHTSINSAQRALRTHQNQHCPANAGSYGLDTEWIRQMHQDDAE